MAIIITGNWAYAETEAEIDDDLDIYPSYCIIYCKDTQATYTYDELHDPVLYVSKEAKQDPLVSGTSIKTVNSNSLLGSGNIDIGRWGDITGTLSSQSDLQAELDAKQDTLVSATNIKTVNGSSVLGAGDLVVSGAAAWGGITGLLSDQTDLNLKLQDKVDDADVRGGADNLNQRLGTISNFASPNAGGVVSGQYYDNSFQGTASSTRAGVADKIELAPYYTSVPLEINLIGVAVSTAVASSNVKIVIYSSDSNGWPDVLLYESSDISTATTGYKSEALSFTFSSGVQYWVGVRYSSTATLRVINVSSAVNLGLTSSTASSYATILRRTLTFATPATSPWVFTNTDRVANVTPPSIRFRAV
jgi:hypothetical protein